MCFQLLLPLALTAASGVISHITQANAAQKADNAAAQALRNQARAQTQANAVVNQAVQRVSPTVEQPAEQQVQNALGQSFTQAVHDAQDRGALVNNVSSGDLSSAYDAARASAIASEGQDAVDRARLAAKMAAPFQARTLQGYDLQDLGNQISLISNAAQGQAGVDQLKIKAASRVNPFLGALGDIVSGVGQGLMLKNALASGATTSSMPAGTGNIISYPGMNTMFNGRGL